MLKVMTSLAFVIKGCTDTDILVPFLKNIFNVSLYQQNFPTLWKQAAISLLLKKALVPLLVITDQYPCSTIFPNYFNLLLVTMLRIIYV